MEPQALALLDTLIRGGACAILLTSAGLFLARPQFSFKSTSVAATTLCLSAYMLLSSPFLEFSSVAAFCLLTLAGAAPAAVYWAGLELFYDKVRWTPFRVILPLALIITTYLVPVAPLAAPVRGALALIIYADLIRFAVTTSADDLVGGRRQFRRALLFLAGGLGIVIGGIEISGVDQNLPNSVFVLQATAVLLVGLVFFIWATNLRADIWVEPSTAKPVPTDPETPAERAVLARLHQAMEDGAWTQEGLTIGQLATLIDTPEHRLRRVINTRLGHRNFAAFINGHRIAGAKAALSDPSRAEQTVLAIAYEVGFSSLGPFNRAFRTETGQSPTEFRQDALSPS